MDIILKDKEVEKRKGEKERREKKKLMSAFIVM